MQEKKDFIFVKNFIDKNFDPDEKCIPYLYIAGIIIRKEYRKMYDNILQELKELKIPSHLSTIYNLALAIFST